jgi:hypothetical protein
MEPNLEEAIYIHEMKAGVGGGGRLDRGIHVWFMNTSNGRGWGEVSVHGAARA